MSDPNSWAEYGLPALAVTLGIVGVYIASASARQFDAEFSGAITASAPTPLPVSSANIQLNLSQRLLKRSFDFVLASIILTLLLPLMVFVAATVWLGDGKSPVFRHRRLGRDGRPFGCLKFRSMVVDSDAVLSQYLKENPSARKEWEVKHKLTNDPRVTPIGQVLRKTSLDELPQLINVLRGEMSLVGPRPITESEKSLYGNAFSTCFSVPPGMLDPYEVFAHNRDDEETLVSVGLNYATNWSIGKDVKTTIFAVPYILRSDKTSRHDAYRFDGESMADFRKS